MFFHILTYARILHLDKDFWGATIVLESPRITREERMSIVSGILDSFFVSKISAYEIPVQKVCARFDDLLSDHVEKSCMNHGYQYALDFWPSRKIGWCTMYPEIYWETHLGFVLSVRDVSEGIEKYIPIAVIGFEKRFTYLFVRQLESMKGRDAYLVPLDWAQLLYRVLIELARELDLKEVRVLPAYRSSRHPFESDGAEMGLTLEECHKLAERLHILYDLTSRACGFKWEQKTLTYTYIL